MIKIEEYFKMKRYVRLEDFKREEILEDEANLIRRQEELSNKYDWEVIEGVDEDYIEFYYADKYAEKPDYVYLVNSGEEFYLLDVTQATLEEIAEFIAKIRGKDTHEILKLF